MEKPLVFQQDAATILFSVSIAVWVLFEFSMRIRQRSLLRGRAAHVAGEVLIAVGIALRAWSISALGRFFQYRIEVQPEHYVVTGGPYRYVRHPSYTGVALVVIGIALAAGDVVSLAVALVLSAIGLAARIRAEERQLTEALGAQYERFAAHRKRLVPGVW